MWASPWRRNAEVEKSKVGYKGDGFGFVRIQAAVYEVAQSRTRLKQLSSSSSSNPSWMTSEQMDQALDRVCWQLRRWMWTR